MKPLPALRAMPLDRIMWLLAFAFAAGWTISTAMAAHLPRLLETVGASSTEALLAGVLIGPAQVVARLGDALFLRRSHALLPARFAAAFHPLGAGILTLGAGAVPAFAQAAAPLLFGVLIDMFGAGAFFFSAALGFSALAALCLIRMPLHVRTD